jgi:hypothetical protein
MRHANARHAQILFAGAIALLVALPACGQGSSTGTTLPEGATGSDDGSSGLDTTLPEGATGSDDGSSGLDATGTGDSPADGNLDADRADSGAVHCAVDAGACAIGQVCLDNVFVNGLQRPPDSGPPPPPSESYSCVADPCGENPDATCYCTLCNGGGMCQASGRTVMCTTETVCASGDTPIATEDGDRPIASIRVGDRVYSADRGALRLVPVARVGRVAVFHHRVVEIALSTGAVLRLSAGHPTADGRKIGELMPGAHLDDAIVLSRRDVDYTQPYTYDILPASETHAYVAGGVLVGSTIEP